MVQPIRKREMAPSADELAVVQHELMRMLASHTFFRGVLTMVGFGVVARFADESEFINDATWQAWYFLLFAMQIVRLLVSRNLPRLRSMSEEAKIRWSVFILGVNGFLGGAACLIFPFIDPYLRAIVTMVILASCSIVVSSTFGFRPTAIAYVGTAMPPVCLAWALNPVHAGTLASPWYDIRFEFGWIEGAMCFIGLGYSVVLIVSGSESFSRFQSSIITQFRLDKTNSQLESALKQAEQASAAKTRFLAAASHDLRQPIHTLSLFCAALNLQKLDDKSRQIAGHMTASMETLSSQLDRLLDISKLDAGIVEVNRKEIDLACILDRLQQEFNMLASSRGIAFSCGTLRGALVRTDPTLLELVLRNIVDNAFKYTEKGSVAVTVGSRGNEYLISVSDTGCGIAEEDHEKVFEEFYQVGNPQRDRSKGLGLGLAIVTRLVDLLDIRLDLFSTLGAGSRFDLIMEKAESGSAAIEPERIDANSDASIAYTIKVLVLDDEVDIREGMRILLESRGWQVITAENPEIALQRARQSSPDVLLVDFRLANGANGIEAIRQIRAVIGDTPALLISGDTAPQRLREATEAGIPLFTKPVPARVLEQAIQDACRQRKEIGA